MSEYIEQADDFLKDNNIQMTATYLGHFPRLGEYAVSNWQVTFTRPEHKPFTLTFSRSINSSWSYQDSNAVPPKSWKKTPGLPPILRQARWPKTSEAYTVGPYTITPTKTPPTAYDVLVCITKDDPGTFKDFCGNFGYNDDSIKDFDTYRAVQEEWKGVRRLFGDCLEGLQEIN